MKSGMRRVALLLSMCLVVSGCSADPTERLALARAAAVDKNLDNFTKLMTRESGIFLRNVVENQKRSKFEFLKDPFNLIPEGDVEDTVIEGKVALLKVKGKKGAVEVRMYLEHDEWALDIFSLPALWKPVGGTP